MSENTKIEWADHTFNPWEGCQKVGPGCDHCYAEARNARFGGGVAPNWGSGAPRRRTSAANWREPIRWQRDAAAFLAERGRRQRVFCASLADVFDNAVDPQWRRDLFSLIDNTPDLDWLLLTKRIGNVDAMMRRELGRDATPTNVWLGATIVDQAEADRDIPKLLATPAAKRFLSCEPLLGPVDLWSNLGGTLWIGGQRGHDGQHHGTGAPDCPKRLHHHHDDRCERGIDWVIVGGESGVGARPMHPDWARSLRDQCAQARVPFLFKQWGAWAPVCAIDDTDVHYHPAPENRPDASRRCKVQTCVTHRDGTRFEGPERYACGAYAAGRGAMMHMNIGKHAAGRLLDGVTHDGMPA